MKKQFIIGVTCLLVCQSFKVFAQWQKLPLPPMSLFPNNSMSHTYFAAHFLGGDTIISFVNYANGQEFRTKALYSYNGNQSAFEYYDVPSIHNDALVMYNTSDGHVIVSLDLKINKSNITQWDTLTNGFFKNTVFFSTTQYHATYFDKPNMPLYTIHQFSSYEPLYKRRSYFEEETMMIDTFTFSWSSDHFGVHQSFYALDSTYLWARLPFPMGTIPPLTALRSIGRFHKSIDGGKTWIHVPTNLDTMYHSKYFEMRDIYFVSKDTGYMYAVTRADNGVLLDRKSLLFKTTDGGSTWTKIFEKIDNVTNMFLNLFFINQNIGFAYAPVPGSRVHKTMDGGITWHEDVVLSQLGGTGIREMKFENGILSARNRLDVFYTKTFDDPVPNTSLAKNQHAIRDFVVYPNPTNNGFVHLSWNAQNTNESQIWVYDVMGRVVHQAVHTPTSTGEVVYPLQTHLSPGSYFVKVVQGEQYATKTFVITGK
jgi:hypothetical protein